MKPATTNPAPQRTRFLYLVAAVAAIGGVLFGFDTGVISGAILFITQQFHLKALMEEVTTSAVLVGALIGGRWPTIWDDAASSSEPLSSSWWER